MLQALEIDDRRAAARRRAIDALLRGTVKRALGGALDIPRLRAQHARLDQRFAVKVPHVTGRAVEGAAFAGEWIESVASASPPGEGVASGGAGERPRVLLYLHGGAFLFRFPRSHGALLGRLVQRLGARGLMLDYRLAPEHRYPAALDDAHAAFRWLLGQGIDASRIVIAGDSAGGNLVLGTLLRIKAAGEPTPAAAVALSPFADFMLASPSLHVNERSDPMLTLRAAVALRELYAPPERWLDPMVSPVYADLTGLPPLLLQVSRSEMLLDDARRLAARADQCGVAVQLQIWGGMPHVFQAIAMLPQSGAAIDRIAAFVDGAVPREPRGH